MFALSCHRTTVDSALQLNEEVAFELTLGSSSAGLKRTVAKLMHQNNLFGQIEKTHHETTIVRCVGTRKCAHKFHQALIKWSRDHGKFGVAAAEMDTNLTSYNCVSLLQTAEGVHSEGSSGADIKLYHSLGDFTDVIEGESILSPIVSLSDGIARGLGYGGAMEMFQYMTLERLGGTNQVYIICTCRGNTKKIMVPKGALNWTFINVKFGAGVIVDHVYGITASNKMYDIDEPKDLTDGEEVTAVETA